MDELVKDLKIPMDQPLELVVLAVKKSAMRCRVVASGEPITFRKVRYEVEGEIITVKPSKLWRYKKTHYMTGEVESKRIDIEALGLKPLALKNMGEWNPKDEYWGEKEEQKDPASQYLYLKPIIDYGVRPSYEMEQIIPCPTMEPENIDIDFDIDSDPIFEAAEYHDRGDDQAALKIIEKILTTDLRCLDAHAHLGNWEFNSTDEPYRNTIDKAKRHYEVGVKIGDLSFIDDIGFNGVLRWGHINNRPFLRCLHGYGLSLWRLGKSDEAREVFNRMLWLNPLDNQGIRFLLADIDAGKTWYEVRTL
jgi:tetratricopeptide (TPR) repeat protein